MHVDFSTSIAKNNSEQCAGLGNMSWGLGCGHGMRSPHMWSAKWGVQGLGKSELPSDPTKVVPKFPLTLFRAAIFSCKRQ